MLKANRIVLLTMGMLMSAPGFADDTEASNTSDALGSKTLPKKASFAELKYASYVQSFDQVTAMTHDDRQPQLITDFDSYNTGIFARVSNARSLSLLTVAETGKTRLFLGVNGDGVLGLHFHALPRHGTMPNLELLRMPYLEKNRRGSEARRRAQESN